MKVKDLCRGNNTTGYKTGPEMLNCWLLTLTLFTHFTSHRFFGAKGVYELKRLLGFLPNLHITKSFTKTLQYW